MINEYSTSVIITYKFNKNMYLISLYREKEKIIEKDREREREKERKDL